MNIRNIAVGISLACCASVCDAAVANPTVTVKILGFNDFHGQIVSPGNFAGA